MAWATRRRFPSVVAALGRFYGAPTRPVSRDPFHLVLYEQVAYLACDQQRRAAYRRLQREAGLTPEAILRAPRGTLEDIARSGGAIGARLRAGRMRRSAQLVVTRWQGDLRRALVLPLPNARAALTEFPMIGRPGAERILAATGAHPVLGLDSNALRVLLRIGWGEEQHGYSAMYRSVQAAVAPELPARPAWLAEAAAVLRRHGQELCRRTAPACHSCPVLPVCDYGSRAAASGARGERRGSHSRARR